MSYASRSPLFLIATLTAALAAVSASTDVRAHSSVTSATDNCNGALPGYEGALRKRPLGIANEGTSNAFVNCGAVIDEHTNSGLSNAAVFMINRSPATQAVTCTFVDGLPAEFNAFAPSLPLPTFHTKAIAILPGTMNVIQWLPGEFGLETFSEYGSFSCNLPPKVEINIAGVGWQEDP